MRGDARALPIAGESVHAVVTSPPYNVGIGYEAYDDTAPWPQYETLAAESAREIARVLVPGGRAWVNVMPAVPLDDGTRYDLSGCWHSALTAAGLRYRDTVIWVQDSHDGGCAWGSWGSPSAPNLRGGYEVILSFFKGEWRRQVPEQKGYRDPTVSDWPSLTRNVWTIRPARRKADAPAPFPDELASRCIRLSTFPGEVVLDPFSGSGVTARCAHALGRWGIGVDLGSTPQPAIFD